MARETRQIQPSREEIVAQLEKVVQSTPLAASPRLIRFLRFIVMASLDGNHDSIREYTIGLDVYDRGASFDPKADSIVRGEARRLRKAIEEYYAGQGHGDPVVISIAKGGYVPTFGLRPQKSPALPASPQTLGAFAAVLLIAALGWYLVKAGGPATIGDSHLPSIAVLPFENLSGDSDQEYIADAVVEALTTDLGRASSLHVFSRTTTRRYKDTDLSLPAVAAELGVDYLVEGALLQPAQGGVRVTVQLIRGENDSHIWAHTFSRPMEDFLNLQREAARAIIAELGIELTPQEGRALGTAATVDRRAYEAYLKGRWAWGQWTGEGAASAIDYLEESIRLDPEFAPAYAWLASAYRQSAKEGFGTLEDFQKATRMADRALELDPELPDAHFSRAVSHAMDFEWKAAGERVRKAIALNPNDAESRHVHAVLYLAPLGRIDEAIDELRFALDREPTELQHQLFLGLMLHCAGRDDEAEAELSELLRLNPNQAYVLRFRSLVYLFRGDYETAIADLERAMVLSSEGWGRGYLAYAYGQVGNLQEAKKHLQVLRSGPRKGSSSFGLGMALLGLGRVDESVAAFEQAAEMHEYPTALIRITPIMDKIRDHPRYPLLLKKLNLKDLGSSEQTAPRAR